MVQDSRLTSYQPEFDSLPPHSCMPCKELIIDVFMTEISGNHSNPVEERSCDYILLITFL